MLGALVLGALAAICGWSPLAEFLSRENIVSWSRTVGSTPWAAFVLVLSYTPAALVLLRRPALTLIAIVSFGAWLGLLYSAAGIMLAALATYWAGRMTRPETVLKLAGPRLAPASELLRQHGVLAVFASNMTPVPPFAVQGMIAGDIKLWQYTLGSDQNQPRGSLARELVDDRRHRRFLRGVPRIGAPLAVAGHAPTRAGGISLDEAIFHVRSLKSRSAY